MDTVTHALDAFIQRSLSAKASPFFTAEYDPDWTSTCEIEHMGNTSHWRPTPQINPLDFSGLANAAETPIHSDIQSYYSSFWSGSLQGKTKEGPISLIQLWNPEDFDRLIENLVGHLFMKMKAKQSFTIFFATTEEHSEYFLSIDNATGKILLEEPGKPPVREIESDIATFLNRIEPDLSPPVIY
jgi:SecY interacting protein Syd